MAISVKLQKWTRPSKDLAATLRMRNDCNAWYGNIRATPFPYSIGWRYSLNSRYNKMKRER
nr:MAG TPA: hypothetical protein [Caudoviricetes sp.]